MRTNFAIWDHFERRDGVPVAEQYRDKIRLLQEAEKLGFHAYHIAEHHLTSLDLAPSPNLFLAALAQATHTLRFGTMVYIAPLYHPTVHPGDRRCADLLLRGRLQWGDIAYGEALESMQIFAEEVMPLFKTQES